MNRPFSKTKKKLSQLEVKKLMNEHKNKAKEVKKIDSPLAKYNEHGQLTCVLCKSVVRSEAVWTVHLNAKQHKQNVELAKKLKERTNNFTTPLKRPLTPPLPDVPQKKVKGILKNANPVKKAEESSGESKGLPEDFFHSNGGVQVLGKEQSLSETPADNEDLNQENTDVLPEGFFDDPKLDAKARNQEYKDPVEEEWERFVKAIKEADNESNAIIAEDQEEATTERQIDEIDEQMKKLSKVLALEKKKEEIVAISNETKHQTTKDEEEEVENEFDEFLDWRAKSAFK